MAKKSPSKEEALHRAKEELGEEPYALLMALDPEIRNAILIAGRPPGKTPGPKRGSGADWTPWSLRIAEMMIDGERFERVASRKAAEEFKTATGNEVHPDTLRKHYRANREALHASVLARRSKAAAMLRPKTVTSPAHLAGQEVAKLAKLRDLEKQLEAEARKVLAQHAKLVGAGDLLDKWRLISEEGAAALREKLLGLNYRK
jgi:hypothetical protein